MGTELNRIVRQNQPTWSNAESDYQNSWDKHYDSRFAARLSLAVRNDPSFAGEKTSKQHAAPQIAKMVCMLHESKLTGYDHAVLDMHLSAQARSV